MDEAAAGASGGDRSAVDGYAALGAGEGQLAVGAENLIGVTIAGQGTAGFSCGDDGGIVHEMAVAALVDFVAFGGIDDTADGVVIPAEGEF